MRHEVIAVDVDDVLLDFGGRVIETVNMEYGTHLKLEDIKGWNLNELLDPILGEDWWQWWEERDWLWVKASAIPGAIGGLRTLHQRGHLIHLVTAKPDWARQGLNTWLGRWNPWYDMLSVGPALPAMNKVEWTNATLLIDDKPENCEQFLDAGREAILFNRPHNKSFASNVLYGPPPGVGLPRAANWRSVLDIIEKMEANA